MNIDVRALIPSDAEKMLLIEQRSHRSPWSLSLLKDSFGSDYLTRGLYNNSELCGYFIVNTIKVCAEATLQNICVAPEYQGQGFGHILMNDLIDELKSQSYEYLFLEVRASNENAILLYKKVGFQTDGTRKDYYQCDNGLREDAVLMSLHLSVDAE